MRKLVTACCGLLLAAGALTACAAESRPQARPVDPTPAASTSSPESVYVVGDSNSTGFQGTLETGLASGAAWAARLPPDVFSPVMGWAVDGATSAAMLRGVEGTGARADRLIVMAGTNDLATGVAPEAVADNIVAISAAVPTREVLVLAIAPFDAVAAQASALNDDLAALAAHRGWDFFDPWTASRGVGGAWAAGASVDGVHATPEGYAAAGDAVARHLEMRS
ncbi:SGNH/GDSL hydrolase family protein [Microbacterium enclense]|uniref:SGNH/GDSL hydrolase family protein n=1 Tax=Microbacterium enclense TaxID=993073 RepID=UPI003F7F48F1